MGVWVLVRNSLGIEGPGAHLSLPFYPNLQSWVHGIEKEPPKRNKVAERDIIVSRFLVPIRVGKKVSMK